jgi:hypothetical protein
MIETDNHDRVAVQLPARWNLCKAIAVDLDTLVDGTRVRATGTVSEEGALLVCSDESHQLVALDAERTR